MQAAFIFHHINPPCKQQSNMSCPLYGNCQLALMFCTVSGYSSWQYLASFEMYFFSLPHLCNLFSPLYQHRRHKFSFCPSDFTGVLTSVLSTSLLFLSFLGVDITRQCLLSQPFNYSALQFPYDLQNGSSSSSSKG